MLAFYEHSSCRTIINSTSGTARWITPLLATGSGLLFNGGLDHYLRAFDADTGKVIWETRLPSQTIGGAITYSVNGRQYIAIAAGGGAVAGTQFSLTPEADMTGGNNAIYVFALPQ